MYMLYYGIYILIYYAIDGVVIPYPLVNIDIIMEHHQLFMAKLISFRLGNVQEQTVSHYQRLYPIIIPLPSHYHPIIIPLSSHY